MLLKNHYSYLTFSNALDKVSLHLLCGESSMRDIDGTSFASIIVGNKQTTIVPTRRTTLCSLEINYKSKIELFTSQIHFHVWRFQFSLIIISCCIIKILTITFV